MQYGKSLGHMHIPSASLKASFTALSSNEWNVITQSLPPIFNMYLLGKIAINKVFGVFLVLIEFLIGLVISLPYFQDLIPNYIIDIICLVYLFIIIILFFIMLSKYFKVKKRKRTVYVNYVSENDDKNINNNQFISKEFTNNNNESNEQNVIGESFDLPKVDNSYLNLNKKNDDIENLDDNS